MDRMFGHRCGGGELHSVERRQPRLWRKTSHGWFVQYGRNFSYRRVAGLRRQPRLGRVAGRWRQPRLRRGQRHWRIFRHRRVHGHWRIFCCRRGQRHWWINRFWRDHDDNWRYDRHRRGFCCWRDHGCAHLHARRFTDHAADYGFLVNRGSRMAPTRWRWQVGNDWRPVRQHF